MAGPADPTGLRALLFGDCDLDAWPAGEDTEGEPWSSFVRARAAVRAGSTGEARSAWQQITEMAGVESRQVLQAWHFLRSVGVVPSADVATQVLGAVAEVAVPDGHDVLAAYGDGSVRFLSYSGAAVVVDQRIPALDAPAAGLLEAAAGIAAATGPWEGPMPDLPAGSSRLTALTPLGPHFGQGPDAALRADPMAAAFFDAATSLLLAVTSLGT
jgi:hypothetical protein